MFPIRLYRIADSGKDSRKKRVVIIFPVIMIADGFSQKTIHFWNNRPHISTPYSLAQILRFPGWCAFHEPFYDRITVNFLNFFIGNHERGKTIPDSVSIFWPQIFLPAPCQISGQIQYTPKVFIRTPIKIIGQIFIDFLDNITAAQ